MDNFLEYLKKLPLWLGWIINALAWVIFVITGSHFLEILMGIACCIAFYIGLNKKNNNLMAASAFDAVWMFAWGFGFFGSYIGLTGILKLIGNN